ncbi:sulfatase-like hydrolase/transferase [Coraliomargarita algicola]|uniref:Sulfatase-like hydrolase/transferase n=1 Tax=Coraliomargarita algicola TaxID=3092156 RepID=A0ABZ0RKD6_9BACT|nr:sulfatase-like hydrolase/transferase [Coraliomargarita sp. J2-16]WPJ95997.1 sulfatase-like hydrolase/transferase [Coraliomargarita sp. J2-16]
MKVRKKLLLALCALSLFGMSVASAARPNIISIVVDDMGYSDLGSYGGEAETPNIDRLAAKGYRFTNYRTYPKCMPTRDSLLSGLHAEPHGVMERAATIGEVLKAQGYQTYFCGKTHGELIPELTDVLNKGFVRSFGNTDGGNYFDHNVRPNYLDGALWEADRPYYKTDVQTDFALEFIDQYQVDQKPFFLHLAYHAPHFPVQAHEKDIQKYLETYMAGPDALRKARFERMKAQGIAPPEWKLSPSVASQAAWEALSLEQREQEARVMATHTAMIDIIDQNIGRLLEKLEAMGCADNTMITFVSDNGGTREGGKGIWTGFRASRMGKRYDRKAVIGSIDSHWQIGAAWENLVNTPFWKGKNTGYEGGDSAPLIVYYPGLMQTPGTISRAEVAVWDLYPTWLDVAGASYPEQYNGRELAPLVGTSLLPVFQGQELSERSFYFMWRQNKAFIHKGWKLVSGKSGKLGNLPWELYDLNEDRAEQHNLAKTHPEKLQEMVKALHLHLGEDAMQRINQSSERKKK